MTKIRINKIDAARRQIDAAIRMTFRGEDPVAVHSVTAAGHRIIRDICEKRKDIESYLRFTDWIAPGHEAKFWHHMNLSANFIKHANTDDSEIHELDVETADFMLVFASQWFGDLGNTRSIEMNVFCYWWSLQHPNAFTSKVIEAINQRGYARQHSALTKSIIQFSRAERLKAGLLFLESATK